MASRRSAWHSGPGVADRIDLRAAFSTWVARFSGNNLLTYASAIALQLLVALAAVVFLCVALLRPLGAEHAWRASVVPVLSAHLAPAWMVAILWSVHRETTSGSDVLLVFGVLLVVWEVSGSVRAVMGALNGIYGVHEGRSFTRRFVVSFLLAVLIAPLLVLAMFFGAGAFAVGGAVGSAVERVLVPAGLAYVVVAALVLVAPARRQPWQWVSLGSVCIIVAWLGVSAAYAAWLSRVVDLHTAEGALALVLSLVGYLYASSIAFLVGAQIDQLAREGGLPAVVGGSG